MVEKNLGRLETLREASRLACKRVLEKRSDVIAVYVVCSVARGNIHERSDVDIIVVIEQGDDFERESLEELGCSIDIFYNPLKLWKEELYYSWGSEWEVNASSVVDSLVLYDRDGLIQKTKEELETYPEEKRRRSIRNIHDKMTNFSEAVWYHYINKNYDIESIFSKLYAMESLKILFPINKVYLKADKHMFKQVEELQEKPPDYLKRCLSLLWFKSQNVNNNEATWVINTVNEIKKAIEAKIPEIL